MAWYTTDNLGTFYTDSSGMITIDIKNVDREKLLGLLKTNNNTKKETEKMEAKKCDRCGKLYEIIDARKDRTIETRFKFISVPGAEDMSGNKIIEKQTKEVRLYMSQYDDCVDLCPECRKSFKKWFESTDKGEK